MKSLKIIILLLVLISSFFVQFNNVKGAEVRARLLIDVNINGTYNVDFWKFKGGRTTDFASLSRENFSNLNDVVLERFGCDKIEYLEPIKIDRDLNLSRYVDIDTNKIEVLGEYLPEFNKSARLTICNLRFINPRILGDGGVCQSSVCMFNSYVNGSLSFNVTHFTSYSVEETPLLGSPGGSSGGGGGGGSSGGRTTSEIIDFNIINPASITISSDDKLIVPILLINNGNIILNEISLELKTENKNLNLELDKNYILKILPGGVEKVNLIIEKKNEEDNGVYQVEIIARVNNPSISESGILFISLLNKDDGERKIALKNLDFLKEIIQTNSECLELRESVGQIENLINKKSYQSAINLANSAIQVCKDLISYRGEEVKVLKKLSLSDLIILLIEMGFFFLIFFAVYNYYEKKKLMRKWLGKNFK